MELQLGKEVYINHYTLTAAIKKLKLKQMQSLNTVMMAIIMVNTLCVENKLM